jgi:hypothetical protein
MFLLCFCVLSLSCSRKNIPGTYYSKKSDEIVLLRSDYSFAYSKRSFEFLINESFGIWSKINKHQIEIQSGYQDKTLPIFLKESYKNNNQNNNIIKIDIPKPLMRGYEFTLYIDDSIDTIKNVDSIIEFNRAGTFNYIYIDITGTIIRPSRSLDILHTNKFYKKVEDNYLHLGIGYNDSLFNYKIFRSQKIILKKHGILLNNIFFKRLKSPKKDNFS